MSSFDLQHALDTLNVFKDAVAAVTSANEAGNDVTALSAEVKRQLPKLITALGLNDVSFCECVGIDGRTLKRWLSKEGKKNIPRLAQVTSWRWTILGLHVDRKSASSDKDELFPFFRDCLPGAYDADVVLRRILDSRRVVALRSRSKFRAGESAHMRDIFLKLLRNNRHGFELNCVWLEPPHGKVEEALTEVRPLHTAKNSFTQMLKFLSDGAEDAAAIKASVTGKGVDFSQAAEIGLADLPVAILVTEYTAEAATKYARAVDVWLEIPVASYSESRGTRNLEERFFWLLVHPPDAAEYWNAVWKRFESAKKPDPQGELHSIRSH